MTINTEIAFLCPWMMAVVGFASAVISLGTLVYTSYQGLYDAINAIKNAPKHIRFLSSDLEDLCLVVDTLQALFNDDEFSVGSSASVPQLVTLQNLAIVFKNCLMISSDIRTHVHEHVFRGTSSDIGTWTRFK